MLKVLLLGLGRWGANHLRALGSLPVELFVADPRPEALAAARKLGVPEDHLTTNGATFAPRADAVFVVTPAETHFALCRAFLEAGKDVFVEKPITLRAADARELVELATARGRILQVGHILRFDTAADWLKQAVGDGRFGRLRLLRASFSGFKRPRSDAGVMFADAIHFVDLFNYLLGQTPQRVTAHLRDFLGRGAGFDDASLLVLDYDLPAGSVCAVLESNYFLPGKHRELTVIGSDLSAVCDFNVAQYKIKTYANRHVGAGAEIKAVEGALTQVECTPVEPLLAEVRAFLECVGTRQPPSADGWAGYESVRVLEAALESARMGQTIALNPSS